MLGWKQNKGSVLLIVILLIAVGIPLIFAVSNYFFQLLKAERSKTSDLKAFYLAEGGLEKALYEAKQGGLGNVTQNTEQFHYNDVGENSGSYQINVNGRQITATGSYQGGNSELSIRVQPTNKVAQRADAKNYHLIAGKIINYPGMYWDSRYGSTRADKGEAFYNQFDQSEVHAPDRADLAKDPFIRAHDLVNLFELAEYKENAAQVYDANHPGSGQKFPGGGRHSRSGVLFTVDPGRGIHYVERTANRKNNNQPGRKFKADIHLVSRGIAGGQFMGTTDQPLIFVTKDNIYLRGSHLNLDNVYLIAGGKVMFNVQGSLTAKRTFIYAEQGIRGRINHNQLKGVVVTPDLVNVLGDGGNPGYLAYEQMNQGAEVDPINWSALSLDNAAWDVNSAKFISWQQE